VIWVSPAAISLLSVTLALFVSALILHPTTDISGRIGAGGVCVNFVGNQDHLRDDAAQLPSVWLCIVHQMTCSGAG
jgi:hypothetical protein